MRFLHIPKTAGSTITLILLQVYPGVRCFFFDGTPALVIEALARRPTVCPADFGTPDGFGLLEPRRVSSTSDAAGRARRCGRR